jgi:hypothetical protein
MLTVHELHADMTVALESRPSTVSAAVLSRVEEIWMAEKAVRGDDLFNDLLFSVESTAPDRITGWFAEYKWFLAQRREPALHADLRVHPLAVTGVLQSADGIVFGRRAGHLEQDRGLWELVPSGGVSAAKNEGRVDLVAQVLSELADEIGIDKTLLTARPRSFAIVYDSESFVSDVGVLLSTSLSASGVISALQTASSREHTALRVIPARGLGDFVNECGDSLAGTSRALLSVVRPLLDA